MNKALLSSFLIFSFAGYVIYGRILNAPAPVVNTSTRILKPSESQDVRSDYVGYEVVPSRSRQTTVVKSKSAPSVVAKPDFSLDPVFIDTPVAAPAPVQVTAPVYVSPIVVAPTPAPTIIIPVSSGLYRNGSYTGAVADASYGYVQVTAVISGGKLTDVKFLDYPQDRQTSLQKSMRAMPILISEAISIQDSNVNTVSGASFTSQAYRESLGSALAQAKN